MAKQPSFVTIFVTIQVNLCQKLLFLHQIIHNMTTDCSLFMKIVSSEHVVQTNCYFCLFFDIQDNFGTQHVMQMLQASEKDLPVCICCPCKITALAQLLTIAPFFVFSRSQALIIQPTSQISNKDFIVSVKNILFTMCNSLRFLKFVALQILNSDFFLLTII